MSDSRQALFDGLKELWNSNDQKNAAQIYAQGCERTDPDHPEPIRGPQQIADVIAQVHAAFPDFKLEITRRVGEGDLVATEWTCTGTHKGVFQAIPPTGRRVTISGASMGRLEGGKIIEERAYFDRLAILQQLGVAPV